MAIRLSKAPLKFHFSLTFDPQPKGWQSPVFIGEVPASDRDEAVLQINSLVSARRDEGQWLEKIVDAKIIASSHGSVK